MHPPHVIEEIPPAGESVSWDRSITSFEKAKVGVISVAMESVSLPLVAEEAGIGRELQLGIQTGRDLAAVWLQVGIQVFATQISFIPKGAEQGYSLIGTFLSGWGVIAGLFFTGKWAIVFSVTLGCQGIIRMIPGISQFAGILGL